MQKSVQELYEELMVLAHIIEDRLHYDETEEGVVWGGIVNQLQDFNPMK